MVRPGSLVELWHTAQACAAADATIIMQAANTGLTGGSTPDGGEGGGDHLTVVISTLRIDSLFVLGGGRQAVCLPGTTLHSLERELRAFGREPHSVIGSSCLGATAVGGLCNNSGGSLIQRGPSYTRLSLFGRITAGGKAELVNHLGIDIGDEPETMLARLEAGDFDRSGQPADGLGRASDDEYREHVRDIEASTPARFNADPRRLFEAAGSAGKLIVFATRFDTFPAPEKTEVYCLGTNQPEKFSEVRRALLRDGTIPISAEYMNRAAFDVADRYGKDSFLAIRALGTDRLPLLFRAKAAVDALTERLRLGTGVSDRLLQRLSRILPDHLPARLRAHRAAFEHHLILKIEAASADTVSDVIGLELDRNEWFRCNDDEAARASLHRFVAAGAAVRFRAIHPRLVSDIVALDVALPRNLIDWLEALPAELERDVIHAMRYGHFFCHVFHQDYIVRAGVDVDTLHERLLALQDARGAEYPAEHNVGHLYHAKPALAAFYRELDPRNQLNPGVGRTTTARFWGGVPPSPDE